MTDSKMLHIRCPRSGTFNYTCTTTSSDVVRDLAARLRTHQTAWYQQGAEARAHILQQWKQAVLAHKDNLIEALIADTGRTRESELELYGLIGLIDRWCKQAPPLLADSAPHPTSVPGITVSTQYVPYPLVGVISPWNFPLLLALIDAVPALMAGCAVLVKPSEVTPRFIEPLRATIQAVPVLASVLEIIIGAAETGQALIANVDSVVFTGSVETGRKVGVAAAAHFIPAFLELGGKDPALVLPSADLDYAASALLWGSTSNAGQACQSIERIYVHQSIHDPFVDILTAKAAQTKLTVEGGPIGPIIAEDQIEIIRAHLEDAYAKGAAARCGGQIEIHGGGAYCRATVLVNVNHSMKVMREETFGPIMPVMAFTTLEEAIQLANDTPYGLSAAVFADQAEAQALARRIDAGAISINDAALTAIIYDGEKMSFKASGLGGSRMGAGAIKRFLRTKALIHKHGSEDDSWWYAEAKRGI
jgi:succinate-semialdehyde dehydrogenase/glutarate-semialdehyde dehydrogenase